MFTESKEILNPLSLLWNHRLITMGGVPLSFGNVIVALTLLLFATRLSRLATRITNRKLIEPFIHERGSQVAYQTFAFYGFLALFVALSLTIAGIPLTVFTVVGGALAIGVGFGSQNIVNNFISGIILLVEKPIRVGDVVELDNISGSVISIGTRSTKIKNADNKIFVVPNSFFLEKTVLNWGYQTSIIRTVIEFGVAYGTDVAKVDHLCLDILLNTPDVQQHPMPKVFFNDFAENNLSFQLIFWCDLNKVESLAHVRSDVRFKINERFKEHKIEMAFPQRDLNLKMARSLDVKILP